MRALTIRIPFAGALLATAACVVACGSSTPNGGALATAPTTPASAESPAQSSDDGGVVSLGESDGGADDDGATPIASAVAIADDADATTVSSNVISVRYDKHAGTLDVSFNGITRIAGAYASVDLGANGGYVTAAQYDAHSLGAVTPISEGKNGGKRVAFVSTKTGMPSIASIVSIYDNLPYLYIDESVTSPSSSPISSNYLGTLIVDSTGSVTSPQGPDVRFLDAPFDNDDWVRYDSRSVGTNAFSGTGYEVGALYESTSREGLVFGSVTHDFWKTGIYYSVSASKVANLNIYSGAATPDVASTSGATYGQDGTHDTEKHGAMTGTTLTSSRIFLGDFSDFRAGLTTFGQANAIVAPAKVWSQGVPFGWMTWGAYGLTATTEEVEAASQFLQSSLMPAGFENDGTVYINIDAAPNVDHAAVVTLAHSRGQKVGTYLTPFANFNDSSILTKTVANTTYTYAETFVHDHLGNPLMYKGAYVVDVTHPGTQALFAASLANIKSTGYDFVKLDFLTHGALEGVRYDASVSTGIQAYNAGMKLLTSGLDPNVFVSLSIAPMFPSQYGHARRVSCDVSGQLNDTDEPNFPHYGSTEYMLNGLTFGGWMAGTIYPFVDPDAMALYTFEGFQNTFPQNWAQTRVIASAVAGAPFLDSTDTTNATASARETALLTNPGVLALAKKGRAFSPIEGSVGYVSAKIPNSTSVNAGSQAADTFVLQDGATTYVAAFNYDNANAATKSISLDRVSLDKTSTFVATDVWTGSSLGNVTGTLSISLGAGNAQIIALTK